MIFKELYIHRSRMIKFAIVIIAFATRLLSYLLKLRTNGPNNSQHSQHCCWAKNVGNYRVCVGTGVQQLPKMLGRAAVHLGKDTTLRLCRPCETRVRGANMFQRPDSALLCYALVITKENNVGSCWLKSLTRFKLCATTPSNTQQHATGCANGRNM